MDSLFADARFRIVTETLVDGLIVIDAHGIIRYVNPGCESLFGHAEDALLGQNVSILMPPSYANAHDHYLSRHRETRVKRIIGVGRELTGLRADGSVFPMYLSVGEAWVDGQTIFVGVIYDLTEKKRAEEMLLHHQKLDAIGQLSGGVAHDFNNILSIIGGNLEMIASHDLSPGARRAILRAQEAANRAVRITHRLLAFARRQPLSRQLLDLNATLQDLLEMLRRSLGETIAVSLRLAPEVGLVDADIDQFETAILNLALNARDAMTNGGQLTIETELVQFDEEPQTADEVPPGRYVRVSVSDTGHGMAPDVRARAVEPFFTTKEAGAGTGLGLSMVYGFLKQLGGHARIYSEVGLGTRVSLFFPRAAGIGETLETTAQEDIIPGKDEVILVVEDDPEVRLITVARLEGLNYRVVVAVDGQSALAALKAHPEIRAGILDVVMPGGMDGHALADAIETIAPGVGLVLTSGYSPRMANNPDFPQKRPFLTKPVSRQKLAAAIRSAIGGGNGAP